MNIQLTHPQLAAANFVVNFRERDPSVRLRQADAEQAFKSVINAQSQQTNVPDDFDPVSPRLVFSSGNKSIFVSQTACQLSLNFPEVSSGSLEERWAIVTRNVHNFNRAVTAFKPAELLDFSSLIATVNLVATEHATEELAAYVAEKYVQASFAEGVASAQIALGYRQGDFYLNVNASAYERRDLMLQAGAPSMIVKIDRLPIVERGVALQLDVNTRPRFMGRDDAVYEEPAELLQTFRAWTDKQIRLVLEGSVND